MFIEAINTLHIRAAHGHIEVLGQQLLDIVKAIGPVQGCLNYLVARCCLDVNVWVVSSHWTSRRAMEMHFEDPSLKSFIELLTSRTVTKIHFNSFFNKYAL
ncbi:MAG: antibiotic biosynthesis monooxygenase [Pseudomonas sp.]|uniref:putative quinol monooxygenase n=1 Tax=Pseudomonas abieticivorans TaxID=2931382 RepID=UPI0020BF4FC9|nr:antibiotic biosynthesis monooxygenase [Pseudomonas sp. PIA16]MDE1164450.1 antibiotic biosynthesis monooxygenase [Pseudomonas sp.]